MASLKPANSQRPRALNEKLLVALQKLERDSSVRNVSARNRFHNPSTLADQYTGRHGTAESQVELWRVFDPFDQPGCFLRVLKLAQAIRLTSPPA